MKSKYRVHRFHRVIFTGTLNQVKKFLINTGEFKGYEKRVKRCNIGRCSRQYSNKRELNFWCGMTDFCVIRPVDRRISENNN